MGGCLSPDARAPMRLPLIAWISPPLLALGIFFGTAAHATTLDVVGYDPVPSGNEAPAPTLSITVDITGVSHSECGSSYDMGIAYCEGACAAEDDGTAEDVRTVSATGEQTFTLDTSSLVGTTMTDVELICDAGYGWFAIGNVYSAYLPITITAAEEEAAQTTTEQAVAAMLETGQTTWSVFFAMLPVLLPLTVVLLLVGWGITWIFRSFK